MILGVSFCANFVMNLKQLRFGCILQPIRHYMASITIRNIPESILQKIRTLSQIEKRSMNNELLLLIEKGLIEETEKKSKDKNSLSKESQLAIWEELIGRWKDDRTAKEIIEDIYTHRTAGRNVEL